MSGLPMGFGPRCLAPPWRNNRVLALPKPPWVSPRLGFNSALGGGAGLGGEQECGEFSQSSVPLRHLSGQPGTLSRSPGEVSCRDLELFL